MTRWNNHDNAVYQARDAVSRFEARGIDLPDDVTAAVAVLDRVKAAKPAQPATDAVRKLILDDASQDAITAALIADLAHQKLLTETNQAEIVAAQRVLTAFHTEHDTLFPQLEKQAADRIAHLEKVGALGDTTLDQLVRARRVADAQALAEVDTAAAELNELYELRHYLVRRAYLAMITEDGTDSTRWRDPRPGSRVQVRCAGLTVAAPGFGYRSANRDDDPKFGVDGVAISHPPSLSAIARQAVHRCARVATLDRRPTSGCASSRGRLSSLPAASWSRWPKAQRSRPLWRLCAPSGAGEKVSGKPVSVSSFTFIHAQSGGE